MLTALDQVANQNHLQMIKALVPHLPASNQRMISVLVKMVELQNILGFYNRGRSCISACDTASDPPGMLEVLTDVRTYCEGSDQELLDQWIQILTTMELYSVFMQSSPEPAPGMTEPELSASAVEKNEQI